MLSSYERRLLLFYLSNVVPHLRGRDEEAKNLLLWLSQHEDQVELPYLLKEDDEAAKVLTQGLRGPRRTRARVAAREGGFEHRLGRSKTRTPGSDGEAPQTSRKDYASFPDRYRDPGVVAAPPHRVPCGYDDRRALRGFALEEERLRSEQPLCPALAGSVGRRGPSSVGARRASLDIGACIHRRRWRLDADQPDDSTPLGSEGGRLRGATPAA